MTAASGPGCKVQWFHGMDTVGIIDRDGAESLYLTSGTTFRTHLSWGIKTQDSILIYNKLIINF